MSERKPPGLSWQSWIDRQITEGEKSGAFDELEGHGKPIRDLDRPHDDDWWIRAKLAREDVLVTPPTIAIRQDRDESIQLAMAAPDEAKVRAIIDGLNERIGAVNRSATWGPPSSVAPIDVDSIVERWRARPQPPSVQPDAVVEADIVDEITARSRSRRTWRRFLRRTADTHST